MRNALFVTSALVGAIIGGDAMAQTTPRSGNVQLEEIIVTAQRRDENLQKAAIAVTAASGEQLERKGVTSTDQLTFIAPALRTIIGQGPYANFAVRGVTATAFNSFAENAVVINADGVPLVHPTGAHGLFYDLERVEVLKGPQGILYGRNATGGAINFISRRPVLGEFGGEIGLDVGNYNRVVVNGAMNLPLGDKLAARAAFTSIKRDGYFTDGTGDEDSVAGRLSVRYEPNSTVSVTAIADWSHDGGKGSGETIVYGKASTGRDGFVYGPYVGLFDPRVRASFTAAGLPAHITDPYQDNTFKGITAIADVQTPIGTLTMIPSYRTTDVDFVSLLPGFYFIEQTQSTTKSFEARLASSDDRRLQYLLGGFYLDDEINAHQLTEQAPQLTNQSLNNTTKTAAAFGQLTFKVTDNFRVVGGLRYSREEKGTEDYRLNINNFPYATQSVNPAPAFGIGTLATVAIGQRAWNSTIYKVGFEWDVAEQSLIYGNVSTGFKAGGFFLAPAPNNSFNPEEVTAYVLGSKNRFLDNRIQLNAEAFYMDYKDQQVAHFFLLPGGGNFFVTDNVGASKIYGLEVEGQFAATENTLIRGQLQWQRSKYESFTYISSLPVNDNQSCPSVAAPGGFRLDCSGRRLPFTPEWVVTLGIDHTFALSNGAKLVASLDGRYESAKWTSIDYLPENYVDSYALADVSLTYNEPDDRWSIAGYVQNLSDETVMVQATKQRAYTISKGGIFLATMQPPRTYGVRLKAKF